ncbi:MAG: (2Fe-2S)-binding protein [Acidobacteria bacterium]|nr:(2Fe-2S)-binding protein [Acidobacteriota bacterium]
MERSIQFTLNRRPVQLKTDDERTLLWVLRTDLGMTGVKYGCGENHCGACTIIVDGRSVRSCMVPVKFVEGKEVMTIEGLAENGQLHPLQKAFMEHGAVQCGFCTPGMILKAYSILAENRQPSREEIIKSMDGELCRCGTYNRIIDAVQAAAGEMKGGTHHE